MIKKKIEVAELRIGNLIYDTEGKVNTVDLTALKYISDYAGIHQATPIPLTEEWLKKFGFEPIQNRVRKEYKIPCGKFHMTVGINRNKIIDAGIAYDESAQSNFVWGDQLKYVHQLQNIFYAISGKELTLTQ